MSNDKMLINIYKLDENLLNLNNYTINYEICEKCSGEFIQIDYSGLIVCNKCGIQKEIFSRT